MRFRLILNERLSGFREWIDARRRRRFDFLMLVILVVGMTLIISSNYLPSRYGYEVGDIAVESVVAPRSVTFENRDATEALREEVASMVEPAYQSNPTALASVVNDVQALFDRADQLRLQLAPPTPTTVPLPSRETSETTQAVTTAASIAPYLSVDDAMGRLREQAPTAISDGTLRLMLVGSADTFARMSGEVESALRLLYEFRITQSELGSARAQLRGLADGSQTAEAVRSAIYEIGSAYLRPNQVLDEEQTRLRRDQAMQDVAPVIVSVLKGQRVVEAGDPITPQALLALEALGLVGRQLTWEIWLGILLVVLLELVVAAGLITRTNPHLLDSNTLVLAMTTLVLLFTGLTRILVMPPSSSYLVPLAAFGMLTSILTRPRTALLVVSIMALNVGLMSGMEFGPVMVALLTAVFSLYTVSHLATRTDLLVAGFLVMAMAGAAVFANELLQQAPIVEALQASLWGLGNGALSLVLTLVLLLIYETVFNLTTPLRMLELANPSQPLLRRLMQVAPGTYNHSILMGNLAEAAAEAIGADPLLARVGAYYHDIGKTLRPEYFIENQMHVQNPHDKLTPSLSKLAIKAHVRDGLDLARAYGLPEPVLDIIKQHHGTSVLAYFYHKAKETADGEVPVETYRYEGEKPTFPESAIIMLADSVEAAAKAMTNPTVKKMQVLIHEIITQKMLDGQLDEAQLTLGDLHKVQEVFENGLRGLAGHRIEYPKDEAEHEERGARDRTGGGPAGASQGGVAAHAAHPPVRKVADRGGDG
jgi:putative nucleotidyltransferase with HDIG domain